jgi:hypothetical protein
MERRPVNAHTSGPYGGGPWLDNNLTQWQIRAV